jgi:hypothetical protein
MNRQLIMAGVFLAVGAVIWLVLLRPVPVKTATGVVRTKTFKPAGQYVQYPPGDRQGFRSPTTIQLAEHYVLDIDVSDQSDEFRYAINTAGAAAFDVGQRVNIEYQTRGLPLFWRRVYVLDAKPAD